MAMGSIITHVGPLGSGAIVKLSTNALLVAVLAELIGLLMRSGADVKGAQTVFQTAFLVGLRTKTLDNLIGTRQ